MKALLLVAHGSRSSAANNEVRELAAALRGRRFALVRHAFLEMAEPGIVAGGNQLVADGATAIVVLPYFLAAGRHVAADVPGEVALLQRQHPTLPITIAPHLGAAPGMPQFIHTHLG